MLVPIYKYSIILIVWRRGNENMQSRFVFQFEMGEAKGVKRWAMAWRLVLYLRYCFLFISNLY